LRLGNLIFRKNKSVLLSWGGGHLLRFGRVAARSTHSRFSQYHFQWAEVRERGLQQVESDESSEPEPILAVIMGQQETDENKTARESPDDHFHRLIKVFDF